MYFFGICFILYFIKMSSGQGLLSNTSHIFIQIVDHCSGGTVF